MLCSIRSRELIGEHSTITIQEIHSMVDSFSQGKQAIEGFCVIIRQRLTYQPSGQCGCMAFWIHTHWSDERDEISITNLRQNQLGIPSCTTTAASQWTRLGDQRPNQQPTPTVSTTTRNLKDLEYCTNIWRNKPTYVMSWEFEMKSMPRCLWDFNPGIQDSGGVDQGISKGGSSFYKETWSLSLFLCIVLYLYWCGIKFGVQCSFRIAICVVQRQLDPVAASC